MLDDQLKSQLSAYLERVQQPFELVASLDDSETARDMRELLETIQSLRSDKITLRTDGNDARKPSFSLQRVGATNSLRFAGLPLAAAAGVEHGVHRHVSTGVGGEPVVGKHRVGRFPLAVVFKQVHGHAGRAQGVGGEAHFFIGAGRRFDCRLP